jgi:hypothetical protein
MEKLAFPVACPLCQNEGLCSLPISVVAEAMRQQKPLLLRSHCHSAEWLATALQTEQIAEYFSACCANRA